MNKLDTLTESIPKTGKEAATIFGVLSYVRAFSKDFAALTAPIVAAITDEKRYGTLRWGDQEKKSLTDTVEALKESCRLYKVRYGEGNDLYIFTDASDFAISAVLFQKDDESNFRLIDCSSRRLNRCERRYSIYRKEACAMQGWSWARPFVHTRIHAHGKCAMGACAYKKNIKSCKIANFAAHAQGTYTLCVCAHEETRT